ncbi:hypothetical protein CYPRO_0150 [Cyclonatronum proteinivorum]|uniref:Uncharacterized protein n=1 Tax=Cyclonatronum proteinivorum TaxID=1457365 RepID=A0A345UG36_9BACT|nr:hypothetical protein CYPRO_0150 [Cyclonatronum proteinivorum]
MMLLDQELITELQESELHFRVNPKILAFF